MYNNSRGVCTEPGADKLGRAYQERKNAGRRQARADPRETRTRAAAELAAESEKIMKKMLSEITNRAELINQMAELLAELDKYPSRFNQTLYARIDKNGTAEAIVLPDCEGASMNPYYSYVCLCTKPAVYDSLVSSFYSFSGDFSDALGMKWADFEKLVLRWIEEEEGGVDDDYEITYDDCLEYAENHPEIYEQLEDIARDAIDGMDDVYKEAAERYFFEALENERNEALCEECSV